MEIFQKSDTKLQNRSLNSSLKVKSSTSPESNKTHQLIRKYSDKINRNLIVNTYGNANVLVNNMSNAKETLAYLKNTNNILLNYS